MLDKKSNVWRCIFMSKYTKEFKLKVAKYCLEERHSYGEAKNFFNIPSKETVRRWCKRYEMHGLQGIVKRKNNKYDGFFKQNVVEYMHNNHLSASETATYFNLAQEGIVLKWERIYYEEGSQALYEERRGRRKDMSSKERKKKLSESTEKDLIAEVQQLRMENEYLKKLNALVQERIKRENKKK